MTTRPSSLTRPARGPVVLVGLVLLGAVLTACGSAANTAATTTTTSGSGAATTVATVGSSAAGKIAALASSVQGAETATFKVVYSITGAGQAQTVTLEQAPPKSLLSVKSGAVIDTGTATYFCSESGATQCLSAGTTNPLASLTALFSPQTALTELHAAQADAALKGYTITFSSGSYAGQSTTCATVSGMGNSAKYCVTKQGVLAYVKTGSTTFQLESYSSSPAASDFALPPGATVETLPAGVTIPD
jgi:hypothetical protein